MPDAASRPSPAADGDLVARAAQGDERAIGTLYDRYGAVLYAVAYRIVGQRADAEEVVLEAFAQAWRDAPRFEAGRGSVAGWLTMIARSRALDLVRARSRRERITASAAAERPGRPARAWASSRPDRGGRAGSRRSGGAQVRAGAGRADAAAAPGDRAGLFRRAVPVGDRRAAPAAARHGEDAGAAGHAEAARMPASLLLRAWHMTGPAQDSPRDLAAAYALGALSADEAQAVRGVPRHLAGGAARGAEYPRGGRDARARPGPRRRRAALAACATGCCAGGRSEGSATGGRTAAARRRESRPSTGARSPRAFCSRRARAGR